jgi:hypothetical protein
MEEIPWRMDGDLMDLSAVCRGKGDAVIEERGHTSPFRLPNLPKTTYDHTWHLTAKRQVT